MEGLLFFISDLIHCVIVIEEAGEKSRLEKRHDEFQAHAKRPVVPKHSEKGVDAASQPFGGEPREDPSAELPAQTPERLAADIGAIRLYETRPGKPTNSFVG